MAAIKRLLDRAVFDPRAVQRTERLLGFTILALVALGGWLIFWPFIPPLIARIVLALLDLLGVIGSALSALASWWWNR
ncbi:MAG: hypothetical protein H0V51_09050 [Chloroflexi bacterium]|nr:hypothetical protein [Chloroflexota bacterium]